MSSSNPALTRHMRIAHDLDTIKVLLSEHLKDESMGDVIRNALLAIEYSTMIAQTVNVQHIRMLKGWRP